MGASRTTGLNLKQVAAQLGVHYMTAYRYVRTGRLAATKVGTGWVVDAEALARFEAAAAPAGPRRAPMPADWRGRLARTLVSGDEAAAWRVLEQALAAGRTPAECYLDLLAGALADLDPADGSTPAPSADGYLATATAMRLVARLGARFRRPGRSRGAVVFGAPRGELHSLPIAIVADLVRLEGFDCLELGANVPAEAFAAAASGARRLVAVGIGVTAVAHLGAVREAVSAVRAVDPVVPVILGGQAVLNPEIAAVGGATAWAADGAAAVALIDRLARTAHR